MKAEHYFLSSLEAQKKVMSRLMDIILDGSVKVTFSDAGSKSAKQRGLDWKWNTEISRAGIGGEHEDTKDGVHLVSKWRFGVPILSRDDTFFSELYQAWLERHKGNTKAIMWFIDNHISTEQFTVSQMAEYMTDKRDYYTKHGVVLTDPDFKGLID